MTVPQRRYPRTARGTPLGRHRFFCGLGFCALAFGVGCFMQFSSFTKPFIRFVERNYYQESEANIERRALVSLFTIRTADQVKVLMDEDVDITRPIS